MAETAIILFVTFLLAGTVKGVVGLGFPTVSLALLTLAFGLKDAMAMLIVPSLLTNIWQAGVGGELGTILKRFWPLLITTCIGVLAGAWVLAGSDAVGLTILLGVLLIAYAVYGLATPVFPSPGRHETWLSPVVGLLSGIVTGLVGIFLMPSVPYLQALGLKRDHLVQAMGVFFTVSTAALGVALGGFGVMTGDLAAWSVAGIVPGVLGMMLGQRIRQRLDENRFRQVLLGAILVMGLVVAVKALS